MAFDGIEVDMLSVGDADCFLVSRWQGSSVARVLIDGGNEGDYPALRSFLQGLNATTLDAVVSTHLHDDHIGGLIPLAQDRSIHIGECWVHCPQQHLSTLPLMKAFSSGQSREILDALQKSLDTNITLQSAMGIRGIPIFEPFAGQSVCSFLKVLGPSEQYYHSLVQQFTNLDILNEAIKADAWLDAVETIEEITKTASEKESGLLDNPTTSPENNSSTLLGTDLNGQIFLFTSDIGVEGLHRALGDPPSLSSISWMQIPHHGSRRNITKSLIDRLAPKTAFVSAKGTRKHPRRAVVNAFKEAGAHVYSTHYPAPAHKRHHTGNVPSRPGYVEATELYEATP